jgi:hypothetical protein
VLRLVVEAQYLYSEWRDDWLIWFKNAVSIMFAQQWQVMMWIEVSFQCLCAFHRGYLKPTCDFIIEAVVVSTKDGQK